MRWQAEMLPEGNSLTTLSEANDEFSARRLLLDEDDALSEVTQSKAVPEEVKEWLASTFTRTSAAAQKRRSEDKPKFRTVANAIRAGIAVDK